MATVTEKLRFLLEADATGAIRGFEKVGDAADRNVGKAQSRIDKAALSMQKWGAGAVAAGGLIGAGLLKAASGFQNLAVEAGKFSDATGVGVENASRWIEVVGDLGADTGALESAIGRLNKTISASPEKLDAFGVAVVRAADGTVDVNETFLSLIDRLNAIEDPAKRAEVATAALGRGWQELAEVIGTGSGSLREALASVSDAKVIDEAELAKAKEFRASMDALRDSGQDLALALGQGAAPVIGALAEAAGAAVSAVGSLNAITGGLVGKVATVGAVALVAGGSLAFMAGKVTQLRASLTKLSPTMIGVTGVIAAATAIYSGYAKEKQRARESTDDFVAALKAEKDGQVDALEANIAARLSYDEFADLASKLGVSMVDLARFVKGQSVPAIEQYTGSMSMNDGATRALIGRLKDWRGELAAARGEVAQQEQIVDGLTASVQRGNHAHEEFATTIDEKLRGALRRGNHAYEEHILATEIAAKMAQDAAEADEARADAIRGVVDALWAQVDAQAALEGALDTAEDVLADYEKAQQGTVGTGDDDMFGSMAEKWEAVDDALRDAKASVQAVAQAAGEAAAAGKKGADAEAANAQAQIDSLDKVRQTLAVGSPLRQAIDDYIAALLKVPGTINTRLSVTGGKDVIERPDKFQQYATGGVVPGPVGAPQLAVVHGGEEVLTPAQRAARGSGGATVTNYFTVNAGLSSPRDTAKAIAEILTKYGYR